MFIAMNRFKVIKGEEAAFEHLWLSRETHLDTVVGFVEFHMLRGPERDDHVLYSSHTVWASRAQFVDWTNSEAFRASHRGAGGSKPMYLGQSRVRGFRRDPDGRTRWRRMRRGRRAGAFTAPSPSSDAMTPIRGRTAHVSRPAWG